MAEEGSLKQLLHVYPQAEISCLRRNSLCTMGFSLMVHNTVVRTIKALVETNTSTQISQVMYTLYWQLLLPKIPSHGNIKDYS